MQSQRMLATQKDKNDWFTFTLKKKSLIEAVKQNIHILLA